MILHGDCLSELLNLPDDSVDSLVTDPPAGFEVRDVIAHLFGTSLNSALAVPAIDLTVGADTYNVYKSGTLDMTNNIDDSLIIIADFIGGYTLGNGDLKLRITYKVITALT